MRFVFYDNCKVVISILPCILFFYMDLYVCVCVFFFPSTYANLNVVALVADKARKQWKEFLATGKMESSSSIS